MKKPITPYLMFNGQANEALQYYKAALGCEITNVQTYGEANFPTPPDADSRIMHARLQKDALLIMVSDAFPGQSAEPGNSISLVLECESDEEINTVYNALCEKGSVIMELQDTFWGARYGKVKDAYGITWDLNFEKDK